MPFLTLDGRRCHYQQQGAGPDIVLIHGVTGDLSIWLLCKAMQDLSQAHRVTAYDLRGPTAIPMRLRRAIPPPTTPRIYSR